MKSKILYLVIPLVLLLSACGSSDKDSDDDTGNDTVSDFSSFVRDVFNKSANSEPVSVIEGTDFNFAASDLDEDYSDLLN